MKNLREDVVNRLYANVVSGRDIGDALQPLAAQFPDIPFFFKTMSLNTGEYDHISFQNIGEVVRHDLIAAGRANPFPELVKYAPKSAVLRSERFMPPEEILGSEFHDLVLKKHNNFDRSRGFVVHREGADAAMTSTVIPEGFGGKEDDLLFDALDFIRPHFQNAFSLGLQLEKRRDTGDSYGFWLERIPSAAFVLDHGMHVAVINASAERLIKTHASIFVDVRGELASRNHGHRKTIEDTIAKSRLHRSPIGPVVLPSGGIPNMFFVVVPIGAVEGAPPYLSIFSRAAQPLLCLVLDPSDLPVTTLGNLQGYFDISKREAELVQHLVQGASVSETSEAMKISYNTARNHLARITSKVSVKSQSELVRMASDLAARVPLEE